MGRGHVLSYEENKPGKEKFFCCLQWLVFTRWYVPHDILHVTLQDSAEVVECGCIEWLVLPEFVNGRTGDVMTGNQGIRAFFGSFQSFPEPIINHHTTDTSP